MMSDNQTRVIVSAAVALGTLTAAGLAYFYKKKSDESIPTKWKKVGKIIDLNCFPIKSCAPIKCDSFDCHLLGIEYESLFDRCFIVSLNGKQITARAYPKMVLIQPNVIGNNLILSAPNMPDIQLNLDELRTGSINCNVECWYAKVKGIDAGDDIANWLSEFIVGEPGKFRFLYYPYEYPTKGVSINDRIWKAYRSNDAGTYHDKTSYMLINQASIDELNSHLDHIVKPLQFRPNLVINGPRPYDEDNWKWIKVGKSVVYRVLKPCTRCIFTNINPETGVRNSQRQPLLTLVKNRSIIPNETPVMGIQLGIRVTGKISIGDTVYINDDSEA